MGGMIASSGFPAVSQASFSELVNIVAPSVVWITHDINFLDTPILEPRGSGFLTKFTEDGTLTIVTACHVVQETSDDIILVHTGLVDGNKYTIVGVHPEAALGFNHGFPAIADYCDSLYDVAILTPVQKTGTDKNGNELYERVPLSTYMSRPGRAWFSRDELQLSDNLFAMGYPGSTDEFNVTFGRVTSRLKQTYLTGSFTEYYVDDSTGKCQVKSRLRNGVVFNALEINPFGGVIPIKWGLDVIRTLIKPHDLIAAVENSRKPVPYADILTPIWVGEVKEVTGDGKILVNELSYKGLHAFPSIFSKGCFFDTFDAEIDLDKPTGQVVALDTEREFLSTDAALRGGNSGGPVFNDRGQLVGMVVFQVSTDEGGNFFSKAEDIIKAYQNYQSQNLP
jgi:hypothetical protein